MQSRNLFPSSKLGHLKRSIHLISILVPSFLFATSCCLLLSTGHSEWPRHPLPAPLSRTSLTPPTPKVTYHTLAGADCAVCLPRKHRTLLTSTRPWSQYVAFHHDSQQRTFPEGGAWMKGPLPSYRLLEVRLGPKEQCTGGIEGNGWRIFHDSLQGKILDTSQLLEGKTGSRLCTGTVCLGCCSLRPWRMSHWGDGACSRNPHRCPGP